MRFKEWLLSEAISDNFDRHLKRVFGRPEPYEILDSCEIMGTFLAGACWIGAEVIARYLNEMGHDAQLYAVWDHGRAYHDEDELSPEPIQQHVVVKVGDQYVDSDGIHTAQQLLNKMIKYEGLVKPTLAPFNPKTAGEIITSKSAVNKLYKSLVATMGDPKSFQ
jgi:hypothetical protein